VDQEVHGETGDAEERMNRNGWANENECWRDGRRRRKLPGSHRMTAPSLRFTGMALEGTLSSRSQRQKTNARKNSP
jgi:hypothetical protein